MKLEVKYIFPTSTLGVNNYIYKLPEGLGMRNISTWYQDTKESTNQGGLFLDFHRFSWSYVGPKSKLNPQTEISSMESLILELSIEFSESWKIILSDFQCFKSSILSATEPV